MAETTQLSFTLRDLTVALIRLHGIREGKWMLGFEFSFGATNVGPGEAEVLPAAFAAVKSALLVRQPENAPNIPFIVDAAIENPPAA